MKNRSRKRELSFLENLGIDLSIRSDDLARIDEICCEFEDSWTRSVTLETLSMVAKKSKLLDSSKLVLELSLIDQELRWRDWACGELTRFNENVNPYGKSIRCPETHGLRFRSADSRAR